MSEFSYERLSNRCVTIYRGGSLLTTYHFGGDVPFSYFHPILTNGGHGLTLDEPYDHPWHHGLSFTWKYINGKNYWDPLPLLHERGRMETVDLACDLTPISCIIRQSAIWREMTGKVVLKEERTIKLLSAPNNQYRIDLGMTFQALNDDAILERDEPTPSQSWKGYAGLSYRPSRCMGPKAVVHNSEGINEVKDVHGTNSKWADYSGRLDGGEGLSGGVAFFEHPDNPRFPGPIYAIRGEEMQTLHCAFLYNEPWTIALNEPLILCYGVYVHEGTAGIDELEREYQRYIR